MTELASDDLRWAEDFGARWGAEYSDPLASMPEVYRDVAEAANPVFNQKAVAHQKRVLGINDQIKLSAEHAEAVLTYHMTLAQVVLREALWALWWRREQIERDGNDPGLRYLTHRPKPGFREFLEAVGPAPDSRMRFNLAVEPKANSHDPGEDATAHGDSEVTPKAALTTNDEAINRSPARRHWWRRNA